MFRTIVRILVTSILCIISILSVWRAIEKYMLGDTTFSESHTFTNQVHFPNITLCPNEAVDKGYLSNLTTHYSSIKIEAIINEAHFIMGDDLDEKTFDQVLPIGNLLVPCVEIKLEHPRQVGAGGMAAFIIRPVVNKTMNLYIQIGDEYVGLGANAMGEASVSHVMNWEHDLYAVGVSFTQEKWIFRDKPNLRCTNKNISTSNCLNNYLENDLNCSLPWSAVKTKGVCPDEKYDEVNDAITSVYFTNDQIFYKKTNCAKQCHVNRYSMETMYTEKVSLETVQAHYANWPKSDHPSLLLQIYYSGNLVKSHKEVLVYDQVNLIGDIGGTLGLFLGASILSCYDLADSIMAKMCKRLISKMAKISDQK